MFQLFGFFYYLLNIHKEQEVKNGQQCKKQRSALKRKWYINNIKWQQQKSALTFSRSRNTNLLILLRVCLQL